MREYLNDFLSDVKILSARSVAPDRVDRLPEWWQDCLKALPHERLSIVVERWRAMSAALPITLTFIEHNLRNIEFISHSGSEMSMIYEFVFHSAEPSYYEGLPPAAAETLTSSRLSIPADLQRFMATLHDGWTEVASGALGPMPMKSWYAVTEDDWELEGLVDWSDYGGNRLIITFNNGGSGYLCIDRKHPGPSCVIWFSDDKPVRQPDYFAVLDAWIEIGFEEG